MSSTSLRRALLAAASIGAALPALAPAPLRAQAPDAADLLRRIFATGEFSTRQRLGPVRWIEGGAAYTALEPSEAVARLFGCSFPLFYDAESVSRTLGLFGKLADQRVVSLLAFAADSSAVRAVLVQ